MSLIKQVALVGQQHEAFGLQGRVVDVAHVGFVVTDRNKANLRDLIAETGLAILLKFDPNRQFFSPCDLEI